MASSKSSEPSLRMSTSEPAKRRKWLEAGVELRMVSDLLEQALLIEPVGDDRGLRVIRDAEVLQAEFHGLVGHFFERVDAVGGGGVVVEGAAQVAEFDEARQRVFGGGFDSPRFSRSSGSMKSRPSN